MSETNEEIVQTVFPEKPRVLPPAFAELIDMDYPVSRALLVGCGDTKIELARILLIQEIEKTIQHRGPEYKGSLDKMLHALYEGADV